MKRVRATDKQRIFWADVDPDNQDTLHVCDMFGERTGDQVKRNEVRLLAPCEARNIICVGKNYAKHIKEMGGSDLPEEPGLFLKALNTLNHPGEAIVYPNWTENLHYEGELALVIGKTLSKVSQEDALGHILGYTCAIDVTARDKQRSDLQWARGKSADGFCPLGSELETELDPSRLSVQTHVNGELKQDGNTEDLIFPVPVILSYISQFMTLTPGDVVLTGTPDGVGPLHVGDTITVTVAGVGTLERQVVAA
jgi:2-keto-4-pentenoate hydratase/2-oxohepta-3-ene-1,7-dioic acid hydratase in catechol pathway